MSNCVDEFVAHMAPPDNLVERVGRAIVLAGRQRFGGDGQPPVWVDYEDFLLPRERAMAAAAIRAMEPLFEVSDAYERGRVAGLKEAGQWTCTKCGWRRGALATYPAVAGSGRPL